MEVETEAMPWNPNDAGHSMAASIDASIQRCGFTLRACKGANPAAILICTLASTTVNEEILLV